MEGVKYFLHYDIDMKVLLALVLWCLIFFLLAVFQKKYKKIWVILEAIGLVALAAIVFWL